MSLEPWGSLNANNYSLQSYLSVFYVETSYFHSHQSCTYSFSVPPFFILDSIISCLHNFWPLACMQLQKFQLKFLIYISFTTLIFLLFLSLILVNYIWLGLFTILKLLFMIFNGGPWFLDMFSYLMRTQYWIQYDLSS